MHDDAASLPMNSEPGASAARGSLPLLVRSSSRSVISNKES